MAAPATRQSRPTLLGVFLVGTAMAALWVAVVAYGAQQHAPTAVPAFAADYDMRVLDDPLELLIVQSDGQAFATLARDPLLRRPEGFIPTEEAAYRAQRPLLGWLASIGSLGRSGWVPPALAVISCAGAGLAAAGAGQLLRHRRRSPWWGLVVVVLPGTVVTLEYLGPEPLVLGLCLWGFAMWERERFVPAVVLLTAAVLGRESAILFVGAIGLVELHRRRWRLLPALCAPGVVLALWFVIVRVRYRSWPWDAGEGRLGAPFVGLGEAIDRGAFDTVGDLAQLLFPVLLVCAVLAKGRSDRLTVVVLAHLAFATLLGHHVWVLPDFYSRVLLPLYAAGLVVVIGSWDRPAGSVPAGRRAVAQTEASTDRECPAAALGSMEVTG